MISNDSVLPLYLPRSGFPRLIKPPGPRSRRFPRYRKSRSSIVCSRCLFGILMANVYSLSAAACSAIIPRGKAFSRSIRSRRIEHVRSWCIFCSLLNMHFPRAVGECYRDWRVTGRGNSIYRKTAAFSPTPFRIHAAVHFNFFFYSLFFYNLNLLCSKISTGKKRVSRRMNVYERTEEKRCGMQFS